ncbi:MAG: phytanoyl-CoA dioxygenase family protein [Deltaproteobacteria bacterium]|nr:phytanoyl-CoA dioxygenase family protein [Kofleriaceae bacterium]
MLTEAQIDAFVRDGSVRLDDAFPRELAEACRQILWRATGCDEHDPATWTRPVVRLGEIPHPLFREAASTPALVAAYDALVGPGRWLPRGSLGTFPIRFPSAEDPGDCGWHVDASFGWEEESDFLQWRVNVASKGRALLMLFLFSDVGEADAPTRIRAGSHVDLARRLAPHGERGLTLGELAGNGFAESAGRREVLAVGAAGTVYLCHPFLVHAAQPHRGSEPRFLAQPPLLPRIPVDPWRVDGELSPVERAIREALAAPAVSAAPSP